MKRPQTRIVALITFVVLASTLAAALLSWRSPAGPDATPIAQHPTVEPSPQPTRPRPAYTPAPEGNVAPIVVQRVPARGQALAPDGAIELVFDRPMDRESVETALSISPAIPGSIEWPDARTAVFRPRQSLARASLYDVVLAQEARAEDGARLNQAYQFRFNTAGFLEVGQVIPADGAQDVQVGSVITVMFNRPVVPLRVAEEQDQLPQPLTFEPSLEGQGEWLNTSVYAFRPAQPLAGGVTYTARVSADLQDLAGNPLQQEFRWSFTTARPQVVFATPKDDATLVSAEPAISLRFNQPLDPSAAAAAFTLSTAGGAAVPGTLEVVSNTLIFTPSNRLAFDESYNIAVAAGLGSSRGGAGMAAAFSSDFRTVPLPKIVRTEPADGQEHAEPHTGFVIHFSAPIDPATVMPNLSMTPALSPTQVYTHFNRHDRSFYIDFNARPSTDYTVNLGPNIADPYGNTIGEATVVRFRTGPLEPSAHLVAPGQVSTLGATTPARVALSSVNKKAVALELYRLQRDDLIRPHWEQELPEGAELLREWSVSLDTPLNEPSITSLELLPEGRRLDPGGYLLRLDQPHGHQQQVLVVSSLNLTLKAGEREALVWASERQSGQPLAGLQLQLYDRDGRSLGSLTTDADGVGRARLERTQNSGLIAVAADPFAAMSLDWSQASGGHWAIGIDGAWDLPEIAGHIYTDRPVYRPKQTVRFKGILRAEEDVQFSLPGISNVDVRITNSTGEEIYRQQLPLNEHGAFAGSLELAEGAALGRYSMYADAGEQGFQHTFSVAAYRPPEFEVSVTPERDDIVRGSPTSATVDVSYFFGGPVADVPVKWKVLAQPYHFAPDWAGRYRFSADDDPWACLHCWWQPTPPPNPILSGSGATDDQGRLRIEIPADLTNERGEIITDSVKLTVEAVATGRDNQAIAGRETIVVHSGQLYLGLAAQTYLGSAGEQQQVDLVAADTQGRRLAGQEVSVAIFKHSWNNRFIPMEGGGGRWETEEQRTLLERRQATTDDNGAATIAFTPDEGGSYQVLATARDAGGRQVRSSLFLWISGEDYISWRRESEDRVTLIADQTSYKPGDTAEILIPSPFQQPHWALITVERGGILSHEVRRVEGNSSIYRLPLSAEHAPNIYVSVALVSPPQAEQGVPADYKYGVLPLAVEPEPQSLQITLSPEQEQARPGSEVSYELQVTDHSGQPVAAELSLDLVDKAVLSLQPRTPNAIREAFYARRDLGVFTGSTLSISSERLQKELEELQRRQERVEEQRGVPGGMAGGDEQAADGGGEAGNMATDAAAPALAEQGQAAAPSAAPLPSIRQEFADTAYWNATVATGADGRASVSVELPDNLTTWVMRGVGFTDDTRVGEGSAELVASKPLLVRPVTPRFLVVGDTARLAANVSNNSDSDLQVQVGLAAQGMSVSDPLTQTVSVPAGGEQRVTWQAAAQDVESVDLVFSAVSGDYSDASRPRLATGPDGRLPVYRYSVPEVVGTGGMLEAGGARTEAIGLPPNVDPRSGELRVRLDPSLAAGMRDALDYLEHYPYGGPEQTVSSLLPNLLTLRALKDLGISNPELEARLPGLVDQGLSRIYSQQNGDGGWGWWGESNPHISAYVVFALLHAREAGYDIRQEALAQGLEYLAGKLTSVGQLNTVAEANQQAWLLYVLARAGRADAQRTVALYENRDKLGVYARAFLALALDLQDSAQHAGKIKTILADLNNAAILSATGAHWEEEQRGRWSMSTNTRTTAIVLNALVQLDADNQLNPNIVRWLMVARTNGVWETTQESAWALIALTGWMRHTGELNADYDYAVWVNDQEQTAGHAGSDNLDSPVVLRLAVADLLRDQGNRLTIGRGEGSGRLYYTAHLRAHLPVEDVEALDRGVAIRRRYTAASCEDGLKCPELSEVKVGDRIRVELSIVAPHDLYYLQVEDPLPAGAEHIDTSLDTTSVLERGGGLRRDMPRPAASGEEPMSEDVVAEAPPIDPYQPWWNWYSRSELRDDKLALFADYLPKGSYIYTYTIRATLPGQYRAIPATASEAYFPEVYGRSDGRILRIQP